MKSLIRLLTIPVYKPFEFYTIVGERHESSVREEILRKLRASSQRMKKIQSYDNPRGLNS